MDLQLEAFQTMINKLFVNLILNTFGLRLVKGNQIYKNDIVGLGAMA